MPIEVKACEINNIYGDLVDIQEIFGSHYKQELKVSSYKLFGAENLVKNPINFFDAVGTDFWSEFYEPSDGFTKNVKSRNFKKALGKGKMRLKIGNVFAESLG